MQPTLETNEKTAVLPIACYPWGGTYRPAAWAQCGLDGESLHLLLWRQEDNRDKPRYLHVITSPYIPIAAWKPSWPAIPSARRNM